MSTVNTHYDVLKVTRDAPPEVIRGAYKHLSQKYHPDRNPGDAEAARIMTLLNTAYDVLSDPDKRKEHDDWIRRQEHIENLKNSGPSHNSASNSAPNSASSSSSNSSSRSYSSAQNTRNEYSETPSSNTSKSKPRKKEVSILLFIGIFLMPYIFGTWVIFTGGYSKTAKFLSFIWIVWFVVGVLFE